jgi:zinc protease
MLEIYRDRFADVSDMTFTVVGNASVDSVAALARTYLGTLPGGGRSEEAVDTLPNPPDDSVTVTVEAGVAERSRVLLLYHGPLTYDRQTRHRLRTLKDVLSIRLREELRESRSGVYNVGVSHNTSGAPDPRYSLSVSFVSDPARAAELTRAARAVIDSVRSGHVTEEVVTKVKEQQRRSRETSLENNGFWVSALDFTYTTPGEDPMDIFRYGELIDAITPARVAATAREYLKEDRRVEATLYPDGFAAGSAGASSSEGKR